MAISNVSGVNNVAQTPTTSATQNAQTAQPTALGAPGFSPADPLAASLLKTQLAAATPAPTTSAALNPRGTFQAGVSAQLQNFFDLPANAFNQTGNFAVNSANQLQTSQFNFVDGGRIVDFYGIPPTQPIGNFPPQTTADLGRVYMSPQGVISYSLNANPLTQSQRQAIQNLYQVDQVSRNNLLANVQNLTGALNALNTANLPAAARNQINSTINQLGSYYTNGANQRNTIGDPQALYQNVGLTLATLQGTPGVNQQALNTALNVLGIGYSNYVLNRIPVNGTNNPTARTAPAPAAFNRNFTLAAAQANPNAVFGTQVSQVLQRFGLTGIDTSKINYQVNSANALQAIDVPIGAGQSVTFFFTKFPPDTTAPPQIAFSGQRGVRQFADIASFSATQKTAIANLFATNAGVRSALITNLSNLRTGLQTITNGTNVPAILRTVANNTINQLTSFINGLNQTPPVVGDVTALYARVGDTADLASALQFSLNATQRNALNILNTSTLPIGFVNYVERAIALTGA